MFTGIIEEIGTVRSVRCGARSSVVTIGAEGILEDVKIGDSIAVNGVCLTVASLTTEGLTAGNLTTGNLTTGSLAAGGSAPGCFTADVMPETMRRSSLGKLRPGSSVNLERAMPANGRFGGHIVSGHIDGAGIIAFIRKDDNAIWYGIRTEPGILRYIVEKGAIAVDGISLTVAAVTSGDFSVSVIPHTAANTILGGRRVGDTVNLENDCIGKYVEKYLKS